MHKKRKTNFQKIKISFIRFSVEIVPSSIGGSPAPSAHLFVFFLNIQFRFLVILKCRERRKLFARSKSEKTMSSMPIPVSQACQQLVQHRCSTYKQGDSYSEKYEILNLLYLAIYSHLAISQYATNSGKWGIPEKKYKIVAQL